MVWRGVAMLMALLSGVAMAEGPAFGEPPVVAPWADLADAAVLRVDQVADFGTLVDVQAALRECSGGRYVVRLLAVGRSEAWFVADILPAGGWAALLGAEPRLMVPADSPPAHQERHAVRRWTPSVSSSLQPAGVQMPPTSPFERNP